MSRDGAIGHAGRLPWPNLPRDMVRFRSLTMGHAVIMGRKTWESLPNRPLPGRANIVLTRSPLGDNEDATRARDVKDAIQLAETFAEIRRPNRPALAFVIGGAEVYATFLPIADRIELTIVDAEYPDADTRFPGGVPSWATGGAWRLAASESHPADPRNPLGMTFARPVRADRG